LAFLVLVATAFAAIHSPALHPERLAQIRQLNGMPDMTWRAGVNKRFAEYPPGVSSSLNGVLPHSEEELEKAVQEGSVIRYEKISEEKAKALPTAFDAAVNWPKCANMVNDIRDQSNCGCCWAFGAAEAAGDRLCIYTNASIEVPLSVEQTCFCSESNGCNGGTLLTPWNYIKSHGLASGADQGNGTYDAMGFCSKFTLPHCHHHGPQGDDPYPDEGTPGCPPVTKSPACPTKCDNTSTSPHNNMATDLYTFEGSVAVYPNDADTIASHIMEHGPAECAFTVYSDFENYVSGIYSHKTGGAVGGHAVKIVGWGVENNVKYWKVANSWNPYWGEKGFFRIVRGVNECGIEGQVTASADTAVWKHK